MTNDGVPQWGPPDGEGAPHGAAHGQQPPYGGQPQYGQQPYAGQPYPGYAPPIRVGPDGAPPLWAPWYGIGFLDAFVRLWKKYARFDGRASRSEWWYWVLANSIVTVVLYGGFIAAIVGWSASHSTTDGSGSAYQTAPTPGWPFILLALYGLWWLATLVPTLALAWRRMHDANLPGPLWLVSFIASPAAIVFGCLPPNPAGAQYDRPDQG